MDGLSEAKADRRIRKTKKALRDGLTKLMEEKSIKDISVKELTDMIDINRGTFYLHYKDVFDMIEQIEAELFHDFTSVMLAHNPKTMNGTPLPLLKDIFIFLKENATICEALMSSNGDIAFVNQLKEIVRNKCLNACMELYRNGKIENWEYYYSFILSGCIGLFETWLNNGLTETPEHMAKLAEIMILGGMQVFQ